MNGLLDIVLPGFCGMGMHLRLDGFRLIYVSVAVLMWTVSGIFSREYMAHYKNRRRYYVFFWMTFVATVGVFLSADLYTTFIFFEIMSFTSYVWVAFDERQASLKAAETYLAVAVIGGMVMLMGQFLLYHLFGTLEMDRLGELSAEILEKRESPEGRQAMMQLYAAGGLMLFGFGAKAGCFPLHIWLPKAHPEAPAPASALLSGILTKTGVFGIIAVSCGIFTGDGSWGLLVTGLGLITMFVGAFLALFSVNLKRTLACSSVSQIGFILTGIGMSCLLRSMGEEPALAVRGALLHMVNHSLFKLVLFLCAGAVFMNLHQLDLNEIRGFGKNKTALKFCFLMGALGIGGIPLWNGYISKTLIHESIVEYKNLLPDSFSPGWAAAEWIFLFTGGMTVAYMLKLFVALFVEQHPTRQDEFDAMRPTYMKRASTLALTAVAVLLPVFGLIPHQTMDRIADLGQEFFQYGGHGHTVHYFSMENLKGGLISITIGIFLYGVVIRGVWMEAGEGTNGKRYVDRWPAWLDLENLIYRPVLEKAFPAVCGAVCGFADRYLVSSVVSVFLAVSAVVCRCMDQGADGIIRLARATTHSQKPEPGQQHDSNHAAHMLGRMADRVCAFTDSLPVPGRRRGEKTRKSMVPALVRREEEMKRTLKLVEESFSFGLMLFCVGLCLTLGYLLVIFMMR